MNGRRIAIGLLLLLALGELAVSRPVGAPEEAAGGERRLGAAAAVPVPVPDRAAAREAMAVSLRAMGADSFVDATASSGRGILVAVIDTGVDPDHPDLQFTPDWERKIADWVDFTGEGDVDITVSIRAPRGGWVDTPVGRVNLGRITSQSGRYRLGRFSERQLAPGGPLGQDINRNGVAGDAILVLVTDGLRSGVYDTVHVDTNGNRDFTDETALREFRVGHEVGHFAGGTPGARDERVPFVAARIAAGGDHVSLGFDANAHGTHVAGVAAAFGAHRGGMDGVAPGTRLLVLKALDAAGDGYWSDIAGAMSYAAEQGAHIVLLSLAGGHAPGSLVAETQLMRRLAEQYGTVFVVAAGNLGPGLGSFNAPGDPELNLAVGAYMSPAMWRIQYGYDVPVEGVWHFSASGPGPDGSLGPVTLAPGSAIAPVPEWLSASGYARFEGTSQAVPHLGGLLALVMEGARAEGVDITPRAIRRAVEEGSRAIPGVPAVRQGHGLAEATRVWAALARGSATGIRARQVGPGAAVAGIYSRGPLVAGASLQVGNDLEVFRRLMVSGPAWMAADRRHLSLPAATARNLEVRFGTLPGPGLHSEILVLDDPATPGTDLRLPLTFAIPHAFPGDGLLRFAGDLLPGGSVHYYLDVPPGTAILNIRLSVPAARGQAQLHLVRPDGRELWATGPVGHPEEPGGAPVERAEWSVRSPVPGVWELVVMSSPALSRYGLRSTGYSLEAAARGVRLEPARLHLGSPVGGAALESTLTVRPWPDTVRARALAFAVDGGEDLPIPGLHQVEGGHSQAIALRPVESGVTYLRVEVGNAPVPGADLSLTLYHRDPLTGRWTELANAASPGTAREVVELSHPPPGELIAYVEAAGFSGPTSFELMELALSDSAWLAVSDLPGEIRPGQTAELSVIALAPKQPGEHRGLILLRDDVTGDLLAALPVLAATRPELEVQVLAPPLVPGRRDLVMVRVRDAVTGHPVATSVEIGGRRFSAPRGEVAYPVTPVTAGELVVDIAVRDPRYAPLAAVFRLSVSAEHPVALSGEARASDVDREKVRNFLTSR
ncbi:MAG TPA: S8 family serine peptidase [Bacillota bacterium]|nr:S8 family serine peptidase [Bacillota bacterium]